MQWNFTEAVTTLEDTPVDVVAASLLHQRVPLVGVEYSIESFPTHGHLLINDVRMETVPAIVTVFKYVPDGDYYGDDSVTMDAVGNDGFSQFNVATATLYFNVTPTSDPTTINIDQHSLDRNGCDGVPGTALLLSVTDPDAEEVLTMLIAVRSLDNEGQHVDIDPGRVLFTDDIPSHVLDACTVSTYPTTRLTVSCNASSLNEILSFVVFDSPSPFALNQVVIVNVTDSEDVTYVDMIDITIRACVPRVCPAGYENNVIMECRLCNDGYYKDSESTENCTACGDWMTSVCNSSSPCVSIDMCTCTVDNTLPYDNYSDCACAPGYHFYADGCIMCPEGYYKSGVSSPPSCTSCGPSPLTTSSPGSPSQSYCYCAGENYELVNVTGLLSCQCEAGYYYNTGSDVCSPCVNGTFKSSYGNDDSCETCGDYMITHQLASTERSQCVCDTEHASPFDSGDVHECKCNAGYERVSGDCSPCGVGTYKSDYGNTLCLSCGDSLVTTQYDTSTSRASCTCVDDNMSIFDVDGYYTCKCNDNYTLSGSMCVPCDVGYYKPVVSNEQCVLNPSFCPSYTTAPTGYVIVSPCTNSSMSAVCGVTCDDGYANTVTVTSPECRTDSTWSAPTGCNRIPDYCSLYASTEGYQISSTCPDRYVSASCALSCAPGYNGNPSEVQCGSDAQWSSPDGCIFSGVSMSAYIPSSYVNGTVLSPIVTSVNFTWPVMLDTSKFVLTNAVIDDVSQYNTMVDTEYLVSIVPTLSTGTSRRLLDVIINITLGAGVHTSGSKSSGTFYYRLSYDFCLAASGAYDCAGVCNGTALYDDECERCAGGDTGIIAGNCGGDNTVDDDGGDDSNTTVYVAGAVGVSAVGVIAAVFLMKKKGSGSRRKHHDSASRIAVDELATVESYSANFSKSLDETLNANTSML